MTKKARFGITMNSPIILGMAALSLFTLIVGGLWDGAMIHLFGAYRTSIADPMQYIRLFTHVLIHADVAHFFGNFMMIFAIGPMVEEKYGSQRLVLMIVLTAFITGLINVLFFSGTVVVGASGIVFMMILLASFTNIQQGRLPITVPLVAILFIGNEIVAGLFTPSNISRLSHILGGLCGAFFGFAFYFRKNVK